MGIGRPNLVTAGARCPFPAPIVRMAEALLVKRGEESVDQADEFIFEFRGTKER